jgi:O-antigen/teichoic acid export membrane protein
MVGVERGIIRRTLLVAGGRIGLLGFWFLAVTLVYRQIGYLEDGLAQAGVLALSLAAIKLFTTALGDPLDLDVVRRVPSLLKTDPELAVDVWRAAQQARMGLALVIVALTIAIAGPVATFLLDDPAWSQAVILVGFAAGAEMLLRGYLADYQSRERFGGFLILEAALQTTRILSVAALFMAGNLTTVTFLLVYTLSTVLIVLCAFVISGRTHRALFRFRRAVSLETWRYARWVSPAMIIGAITERLDIFLLSSVSSAAQSGLYGAMIPLILVPEVAIGFAVSVLQPRVADLRETGDLAALWLGICKLTVPLAVLGAAFVWFFAETIITYSIGPAYLSAAPVLQILFTAVMAWFSVVPVALVFVVMTLPRGTLAITIIQAIFIVTVGLLLIPTYGAAGAAIAVLMMRVLTGTLICIAALWLLWRNPGEAAE